ncbi:MAG: hypothetical protein ACOZCL_13505 [Bacillota bacterium]
MNIKRIILYILLTALFLTVFYNTIIGPVYYQSFHRPSMHMGMGMRGNNMYYIDYGFFIILIVMVIFFVVFFIFNSNVQKNLCRRCGTEIESEKWSICPICGNDIHNKRGDLK